ncbi:hypothetical protein ACFRAE_10445 [Sphingobacterium sp. HJSM2_6]|uniref:hypothetical protein n=1 Tax=Sphingobacterium sp. HJSM2_6 TaxID=3366264 RepID=UPI003BCADC3E
MNNHQIIALDGHDAVGKTTLGQLLAAQLNGVYVRPFQGDYGTQLIKLADEEKFEELITFAENRFQEIKKSHIHETLIFDRHWMTVLSLLPKTYWLKWQDFPKTFLLTAQLDTIKHRLSQRIEKQYSDEYHQYYLTLYQELAKQFAVTTLNTDQHTPLEMLNLINEIL